MLADNTASPSIKVDILSEAPFLFAIPKISQQ